MEDKHKKQQAPAFEIPANILQQFDFPVIQKKMQDADWYYQYSDDRRVWEKGALQVASIHSDLKSLSKLENGSALANILWNTYVPEHTVSKPDFLNHQNTKAMNEKNLGALQKDLKYLGFGEGLNAQLETNIRNKLPEFTLRHQATYNNKPLDTTLHFKQGKENDMYFFNRYDAVLTQTPERQQTFYLDRGNGITTKEAFNLLEGRAVNKDLVNKDGEKYNAWVQLDFSKKEEKGNFKLDRYHTNYGFEPEKALQQYPIKEMNDPKMKEDLLKSLAKGNQQSVHLEINGKEVMHFIQADPKFKDIALFDKNGERLNKDQTAALKINTSDGNNQQLSGTAEKKQEQKSVQKENTAADNDDGPELKKKRQRNKGIKI